MPGSIPCPGPASFDRVSSGGPEMLLSRRKPKHLSLSVPWGPHSLATMLRVGNPSQTRESQDVNRAPHPGLLRQPVSSILNLNPVTHLPRPQPLGSKTSMSFRSWGFWLQVVPLRRCEGAPRSHPGAIGRGGKYPGRRGSRDRLACSSPCAASVHLPEPRDAGHRDTGTPPSEARRLSVKFVPNGCNENCSFQKQQAS